MTPNLYGNLVANVVTGLCGGHGVVPGGNVGEGVALFEQVSSALACRPTLCHALPHTRGPHHQGASSGVRDKMAGCMSWRPMTTRVGFR